MTHYIVKAFDLKDWMNVHSLSSQVIGEELIYSHGNGQTSILLPREGWHDNLIPVGIEPLASFYDKYFGASIGNANLIFATNILGGVSVSHGMRLPDFGQMKQRARDLGIQFGECEQVFMAAAAWMFFYTASDEGGTLILRKYDRDYSTHYVIESLENVLDEWWNIIRI